MTRFEVHTGSDEVGEVRRLRERPAFLPFPRRNRLKKMKCPRFVLRQVARISAHDITPEQFEAEYINRCRFLQPLLKSAAGRFPTCSQYLCTKVEMRRRAGKCVCV